MSTRSLAGACAAAAVLLAAPVTASARPATRRAAPAPRRPRRTPRPPPPRTTHGRAGRRRRDPHRAGIAGGALLAGMAAGSRAAARPPGAARSGPERGAPVAPPKERWILAGWPPPRRHRAGSHRPRRRPRRARGGQPRAAAALPITPASGPARLALRRPRRRGDGAQRVLDPLADVRDRDEAVGPDRVPPDDDPGNRGLDDRGADVAEDRPQRASAPPPRPSAATLIHAAGLPYISAPPTVQSSRFLNEPGRAPAYSGVQNTTRVGALDRRAQLDHRRRQRIVVGVGVEVRQLREPFVQLGLHLVGDELQRGTQRRAVRRSRRACSRRSAGSAVGRTAWSEECRTGGGLVTGPPGRPRQAQNAVTAAGSPTYWSTLADAAALDGEQQDLRVVERAAVRAGAADPREHGDVPVAVGHARPSARRAACRRSAAPTPRRTRRSPSMPWWTPPRRSSLRWFQVASGVEHVGERGEVAARRRPRSRRGRRRCRRRWCRWWSWLAPRGRVHAQPRNAGGPPIDRSVDLRAAARPCRIANIARPARVDTLALAVDVDRVRVHGRRRDHELGGDLALRAAGDEPAQHLELALGEVGRQRRQRGRRRAGRVQHGPDRVAVERQSGRARARPPPGRARAGAAAARRARAARRRRRAGTRPASSSAARTPAG